MKSDYNHPGSNCPPASIPSRPLQPNYFDPIGYQIPIYYNPAEKNPAPDILNQTLALLAAAAGYSTNRLMGKNRCAYSPGGSASILVEVVGCQDGLQRRKTDLLRVRNAQPPEASPGQDSRPISWPRLLYSRQQPDAPGTPA